MFDACNPRWSTLICIDRSELRTVSITFYWPRRTVYTFFYDTPTQVYPRYKYVLRYDALHSQFIANNNGRKIRSNESPLFYRDRGNGIPQSL